MVVVGTRARPARVGDAARSAIDGRASTADPWFAGQATTVVVATGQFLPRPRPRSARPSGRRPGRGPGLRARRGERRAMRGAPGDRNPPAAPADHARAPAAGSVEIRSARPLALEVDGEPRPEPCRELSTPRSSRAPTACSSDASRLERSAIRDGDANRRYHRQSHVVRAGDVHRRRSGDAPAVLHEPRRAGLRADRTCPRS